MPKMTKTEAKLQGLLRKAVEFKQLHQTLSILAVMRLAKSTNEEVKDCNLEAPVCPMVSTPTQQLNNHLQWWYLLIDK